MRALFLSCLLVACSPASVDAGPSPTPTPSSKPSTPPPYLGTNIVTRTEWPIQGMAIDAATLYWMAAGKLRAIPKGGGLSRILASGEAPASDIVVSGGFAWWLSSTEIRRVAIGGGTTVEIVRGSLAPTSGMFAVLGGRAFYVDSQTNRLMDDLGNAIADPEGAPWGLAASTDKIVFACADSIRSVAPDGSTSVRAVAFTTMAKRSALRVSATNDTVYIEDQQLAHLGGVSTPAPLPVSGVALSATQGAFLLGAVPKMKKPPCEFLDKNCTWPEFDWGPGHNGVFRAPLAGTIGNLNDVPYELGGVVADDTYVYFGRGPNLLSEAEIDRIP